jgi:SAM-dependent methyltransferase
MNSEIILSLPTVFCADDGTAAGPAKCSPVHAAATPGDSPAAAPSNRCRAFWSRFRRAADPITKAVQEEVILTNVTSFDPQAMRAFEHAGWQQAAACYAATFAHATRGFLDALLDAAAVRTGMQMLDLACGTGLVAVAGRGAQPVGLDFSAAMLAVARAAHPEIRFEQGDAEALPFADASFDAVVSNFGVHHFPDPIRALSEAHRVLRPGGRVAFTSWAAPAENIAWKLLFDAIAAHGDPQAATTPPSGGGLRLPENLLRVLDTAGFAATEARRVGGEWRFAVAGDLVEGFRRGTVRTAALIEAQPASALPAIEAAIAAAAEPYRRADGFAVPTVAILACGTRR